MTFDSSCQVQNSMMHTTLTTTQESRYSATADRHQSTTASDSSSHVYHSSDLYADEVHHYSSEGLPPELENHCCSLPGCNLNTNSSHIKQEEVDYDSFNGASISSLGSMYTDISSLYSTGLPVISGNLAEKILNEETDSGFASPGLSPHELPTSVQSEVLDTYAPIAKSEIFSEPSSSISLPTTEKSHYSVVKSVKHNKTGKGLETELSKHHKCSECHRTFSSKSNLRIHLRVHNGDRPYHCDLCEKRFAQRATLNTHHRTHTGEKPFKCQYCFRDFSDLSTFTKHKRKHTGERPYSCSICGKAFTQSGNMLRHMKTHS